MTTAGAARLAEAAATLAPAPAPRRLRAAPTTEIGRRADRALAVGHVDRSLASPVDRWTCLVCPWVGGVCAAPLCAAWVPVDDGEGYCAQAMAARAAARAGRLAP